MPAMTPTGIAISIVSPDIMMLPTIELMSPPFSPGGGVVCVKVSSESAAIPSEMT
jgi:hypothetical protein